MVVGSIVRRRGSGSGYSQVFERQIDVFAARCGSVPLGFDSDVRYGAPFVVWQGSRLRVTSDQNSNYVRRPNAFFSVDSLS